MLRCLLIVCCTVSQVRKTSTSIRPSAVCAPRPEELETGDAWLQIPTKGVGKLYKVSEVVYACNARFQESGHGTRYILDKNAVKRR
ncbi:hypothetical protein BDY19DRAFT_949237 [Irpex rosettiformis]|uniref:Uncharacterized protein n=1 Tax=Irpex rosettiformis TaxID=378272 RepID=A0ACB8U377_9APHY|nr:hypothetical protein BDY19DRAFT_949237 [Irpex rosettiformis]